MLAHRRVKLVGIAAAFLTFALPSIARSAIISWTNGSGGNWNSAANWNSGAGLVPGAADTALVGGDFNYSGGSIGGGIPRAARRASCCRWRGASASS